MEEKYARQILSEVNSNYNAVAQRFSRARSEIWPEMEFLFKKNLEKKDKVLDLGCGNGRFYSLVSSEKAFYTGVDFSENLIKVARKKYPEVDFQTGSALNLPFSDNEFHKIFSISVLHHIPSRQLRSQFLKECRRVLKPKGVLIITAWNLWKNPKKRKKIFKNIFLKISGKSKLDLKDINVEWYGVKNCYIHCFTKNELEKTVKKGGFKIIDSGEIELKDKKELSNFFVVAESLKKS